MLDRMEYRTEPGYAGRYTVPIARKRQVKVGAGSCGGDNMKRRNPVARSLFGISVVDTAIYRSSIDAQAIRFRKRWNFDPIQGVPCSFHALEGDGENSESKTEELAYVWTPVIPKRKCDPVDWSRLAQFDDNSITEFKNDISDPTSNYNEKEDDGDGRDSPQSKRFMPTPKSWKQRSITDYMKVKKPTHTVTTASDGGGELDSKIINFGKL